MNCISNCHSKHKIYPHPFLLKREHIDHNYCHTNPIINNNNLKYTKLCSLNEIDIKIDHYFGIDISSEIILFYCFNIKTLDDGIEWIINNYCKVPKKFWNRVMALLWDTYYSEFEQSQNFINMYVVLFKNKYSPGKILENIKISKNHKSLKYNLRSL